jgi:hypothetical protein
MAYNVSYAKYLEGRNIKKKPEVRIEELVNGKVISFSVDTVGPEREAWNLMRKWVKENIKDFSLRKYFGYAPKDHHAEGKQHEPNENDERHEYVAQMFLFSNEVNIFSNVEITDAPKGLFLVGDVIFDQFNDDGTVDIGTSMEKSSGFMFERMKEGRYEMDMYMYNRCYYEEHIFPKEWFEGAEVNAEMRLWLPIKKV